LGRLSCLRPSDQPNVHDLFEYTQDLRFGSEVQHSLFVYVLPLLLELWADDLLGIRDDVGGVVEHLYAAFADRDLLNTALTPQQKAAVSAYMRDTILQEIDYQSGLQYRGKGSRPYRWIAAFSAHGVLLPDVGELWGEWWSLSTSGRAVAAVQYVSCLMYPDDENPVFAPWTPQEGGGPPCLWAYAGHLYRHCWLKDNLNFLSAFLTHASVTGILSRAAEVLHGTPELEIAEKLVKDLPFCAGTVAARCHELPQFLSIDQSHSGSPEWSR
jgi:hypothetical protein